MVVCFNAPSMFVRRQIVFITVVCFWADRLVSCLRVRRSWYLGFGHAQLETENQGRGWVRDVNGKHVMTQLMQLATATVFLTAASLTSRKQTTSIC